MTMVIFRKRYILRTVRLPCHTTSTEYEVLTCLTSVLGPPAMISVIPSTGVCFTALPSSKSSSMPAGPRNSEAHDEKDTGYTNCSHRGG